jgi:glycosyltransferase involved in cell wall biosynthesis
MAGKSTFRRTSKPAASAALMHAAADEANARAAATESAAREAAAGAATTEESARQAVAHAHLVSDEAKARVDAADKRASTLKCDLSRQNAELKRLRDIEASLTWRATYPLRRVLGLLPVPFRRSVRRVAYRLVLRLRKRTHVTETPRGPAQPEPSAGPTPAPDAVASPTVSTVPYWTPGTPKRSAASCQLRALVVDSRWPEPDRDAGSIEVMNLVTELVRLGYEITFFALGRSSDDEYRAQLEGLGVTCLSKASGEPLDRFLETEGESLALCVLSRVHAGGRSFESVRRFAGDARVVFSTVDLHFLREEREARVKGDRSSLVVAAATRERELYLVRQADATIVVSSEERRLIEAAVPGARVFDLPLAREVRWPTTTFDVRSGIGFVGGFAHSPNVDALQFFLSEVWPFVLRGIPDCEFSIAGPGLPSDMLRSMPERVRYLGHVPDLSRWFDTLRVSVAPLRYGAGAKGKVASSLAHGVPCIATPIAVEGMQLRAHVGVLVETSPEALASRIIAAYGDPKLWSELSAAGLEYARHQLSPESWRRRFSDVLHGIGLPRPAARRYPGIARHVATRP